MEVLKISVFDTVKVLDIVPVPFAAHDFKKAFRAYFGNIFIPETTVCLNAMPRAPSVVGVFSLFPYMRPI